ncbi:WecB/TagA/CpsF family glycosyltransferase [Alkalibacterium pelagium]|uniref:N-acetylglucosaminyldiphosphoundecaprenol N-acetyl-beta-D-mannosaminyltransferase n=1 Tax=Alkalibacterium pelagium TaxID=426702 RepID=A0A1H7EWY0_9LACT|nr:WecB/TagA/CpsF family glycosyltransferase [Alkalibacterium pelagium]GEN49581.1 acetylglucosaminyldiphosphoundecaprenol acetyl-beta-D-mannosaminyltransferase [Alkalibacterium pelagium]SEK18393.1 N-acetylglucosaminyldiphosphoundecaprenol N-acetyl-beta-D-mannosaminyltransferase [Alkalibacterium pelagium]
MQNKITILGIPFDNMTRKEFLERLYERMNKKEKTFLVTANPEIVMYAHDNPDYYKLLMEADFIAPDGIGIVQASRKLQTPIKERVPGFELMLGLLELASLSNKRVYFIGAKEDIINLTVSNVSEKWPDLEIAGYHHGYFNHEDPQMIEKVKATRPDIVLVAFGFPRQEKWIKSYLAAADYGIAVGVGGSFDVLSGKTKRAPYLVQRFHIEWLYRLVKQPSRYKRMLALPYFIREVYRQNKKEETI